MAWSAPCRSAPTCLRQRPGQGNDRRPRTCAGKKTLTPPRWQRPRAMCPALIPRSDMDAPWPVYKERVQYYLNNPDFAEAIGRAARDLESKGYAVLPALWDAEQCAKATKSLWEGLSLISKGRFSHPPTSADDLLAMRRESRGDASPSSTF